MRPTSLPRATPPPWRTITAALLLTAALLQASCDDGAVSIRVIFPDDASLMRARRLVLHAVNSDRETDCAAVIGRDAAALGSAVLKTADLVLAPEQTLVFPDLPLRPLLISALVYDAEVEGSLFLQGCEEVENSPDDRTEVAIYLDCAPGESPCLDRDGDGVSSREDCDDTDPCRSPLFTEAKNLCATQPADWITAATLACRDAMAAAGTPFVPPLCGDGIDQDCDGTDTACHLDEDCDGYAPPVDCDDQEQLVNPAATEVCDGIDNNCNNAVDEGCQPCDVDGDLHASEDYVGATCDLPTDDPDDYDAGIHPGTTEDTGGQEGGTVLGALRQFCSASLEKNGQLSHREVDHDGDGLAAADDGCPEVACDADGDGFAGLNCAPPASKEDCDDTDPSVFPGAPDRCGDGVAQNCVADHDCSCDQDGDGYCSPADCNDSDASIHPWAEEICDHLDNDCDRLTDEGNPDAAGLPMPTNVKLCTDDNDGECAPDCSDSSNCQGGERLSGVCACSSVDTSQIYTLDPNGNRVRCPAEVLAAPASPRCFGATQPTLERCDAKDWDCDGNAFIAGQVFVDQGKVCGIDKATCKAGLVEGCDLSATIPNAALVAVVLGAAGASFNPHWICSPGTLLPLPEACNGKDDDCDGSIPNDEKDIDGDMFLPCKPCSAGGGRTDLIAGLLGCADCDDGTSAVNPSAPELCNGVDDNCANGVADDGAHECFGSNSCCSSQKACRDLENDFLNCGFCGSQCDAATSDRCTFGTCACGSSPQPCGPGLNCVSGSCTCVLNGRCAGCCDNNTCLLGNSIASCGDNGETCQTCTVNNPCQDPVCTASGNCGITAKPPGTSCSSGGDLGTCLGGTCCTGCVQSSSCMTGLTPAACGIGGVNCIVCTAGECAVPVCSPSGNCGTNPAPPGTSCTTGGVAGSCLLGNCCTGCVQGSLCLTGLTDNACGAGGEACDDCTLYSASCYQGFCDY